jgi:hypothetical protein
VVLAIGGEGGEEGDEEGEEEAETPFRGRPDRYLRDLTVYTYSASVLSPSFSFLL